MHGSRRALRRIILKWSIASSSWTTCRRAAAATLTIIVAMVVSPLQPREFNGRRRDVVWLARFHRPIALLSFINKIARRLDRRRQGSHKLIAPFACRFGVGVQSGSDGERYVQLYMCELVHIGQAGSIAA